MKNIVAVFIFITLFISGCDKVSNAYTPSVSTELDPSLYPGNFSEYVYPTFDENTNTFRNVLIEDFTGHKCIYCPAAADTAHNIEGSFPDRVFISTIHSDPTGTVTLGSFQETTSPTYEYDFTNPVGLQIGGYFGNLAGNGFFGNPRGNVSRVPNSSNVITVVASGWRNVVNNIVSTNDLKVNIQSKVNFYPSTNGAFIHIEVDPLETVSNELRLVVAFMEDSIVKPQKLQDNSTEYDYVHRDLLKAHINGDMNGQSIGEKNLDTNGKYYFNYSYKVPSIYNPSNCHLLIYVMAMETKEIYQVIKKKFLE